MASNNILFAFLFIIIFCQFDLIAQDLSWEEYRQQREEQLSQFQAVQDSALFASEAEYEAFVFQHEMEYQQFRDEMERQWGDFKERTKKNWVEYKKGGKVRWDVDFEQGKGTVEVLADEEANDESLKKEIEEAVLALISSRGSETEMPDEEADEQENVLPEPVLTDQIDIPEDLDTQEYAKELSDNIEIKDVRGEDGKVRKVAVLNLELVPDHLRTRAEKFREEVQTYSKQYELDPTLVLAIIHTESFFNPMAKSHANALGLMQIVPRTAGRDVYRILNGKDAIPSADFLFQPDQNVLFGATYLDILMNRYLRGVDDKTVHEYLVICAYNTGAGNVARAYINSTNFNSARDEINGMSPQENYDHLMANLPWDETKDYLKKVTERRAQYQQWLSGGEESSEE
ncbi:murein transglycosylase domain-containing protein [Gracilimonas tropica]|uniref:murein transglycosylase domain-containing protein n=1 Tax=Gracilimonas tropica TaxID=454600 RepID=UPI000365C9EE|nr:murein transglycosylase domain-containing protein [Gracilimonas tropica]